MDIQARRQLPGSYLPMIDQENDPGSDTEEFLKFVGYPDQYRKTNTPPPTSDLSRQQTEEQQKNTNRIASLRKRKNTEIKTEYCIMVNSSSGKNFISLSHNNPDHQIVTVDQKKFYDTTKLEQHTQPQQSSRGGPEIMPQQLIPQNFLTGDNHSIVSGQKYFSSSESYDTDDEYSTFFYRQFDDQGTLISEQPPRKKKRISTRAVPNDAYYTITCIHCSPEQEFFFINKYYLIRNFKNHFEDEHPDINKEQTKNYINEHFQEAKQIEKFSVKCPLFRCTHTGHNTKIRCTHTGHSTKKYNLTKNLLHHVFETKQHRHKATIWSPKLLKEYIEENRKSDFFPNPNFSSKVHSNYVC